LEHRGAVDVFHPQAYLVDASTVVTVQGVSFLTLLPVAKIPMPGRGFIATYLGEAQLQRRKRVLEVPSKFSQGNIIQAKRVAGRPIYRPEAKKGERGGKKKMFCFRIVYT